MTDSIWQEELLYLTKELIKFKTVSGDKDALWECTNFITTYLKSLNVNYEVASSNNIPAVIVLPKEKSAPVLLMSHIDVVYAEENLFNPVVKDNKLFGRGSIDDKYATALSLVLLKKFLMEFEKIGKTQKDLPFGIIITADEEIGGMDGAKYLLKDITTELGIVFDGGNLNNMVMKSKGVIKARVVAKGINAHGSKLWLGENAIENLISDLLVVKSFFNQTNPDKWYKTLNIGKISGGESFNKVPDYAEAILDIRYTENDDIAELLKQIQQKIKGKLIIDLREPMFYAQDNKLLQMLKSVAGDVNLTFEHSASDARFLTMYNQNGLVWGADGNDSYHTEHEHIELSSFYKLFDIVNLFLRQKVLND